MRKLPIFILLLGCLAGITYADISPVPGLIAGGIALVMILLVSWAITIVVELVTSFIYLHIKKMSKWILLSVILANIISVPLLWIFVFGVGLASSNPTFFLLAILFGEVAVFVFEGAAIFLLNRKSIKMKDAFVMSFINNLASFLVGAVIFTVVRSI